MNRFRALLGLLTLSTLLVACPEPLLTHTLEASLGTYAQQASAGAVRTALGTAIMVKLRSSNGALPLQAANVTLSGPAGWNADQRATFTYPAGAYWVAAPQIGISPIAGDYTLEAQIGSEKLSLSLAVPAEPLTLELTTITASIEGSNVVNATWTAVPDALGYYARVIDGTLGVPVSDDVYTLEPRARFAVDALNPARAYFVVVTAANVDTVVDQPKLPSLLRMSDSIVALGGVSGQRCACTKLKRSPATTARTSRRVP